MEFIYACFFAFRYLIRCLMLPVLVGLAGCGSSNIMDAPPAEERALQYIGQLSEVIGKRPAGSVNEAKSRTYIASEFSRLGYEVTIQPFSFQRNTMTIESANVIAVRKGRGEQEVIVGGHYDSVAEGTGTGASDNASGIGVMLAIARDLSSSDLAYTLKFVAFGAEEPGLLGSAYYVSRMTEEEIARTTGMINLDTVIGGDKLYVYGGEGAGGWIRDQALQIASSRRIVLETNPGLNPAYPAGTTGDWSDHALFKERGIPFACFEATNWEIGNLDGYTQTVKLGEIWHTDKDRLAVIENEFPGRMSLQLQSLIGVLGVLLDQLNPPAVHLSIAKRNNVKIRKMTRAGVLLDR